MKKAIPALLLLVLVFYHLYPQGRSIYYFGYSFIFASGAIGLVVFLFSKSFFPEVVKVLLSYLPLAFFCMFTRFLNSYYDPFLLDTSKSLFAWFFSAFLIVFIFNKIHKNGSIQLLMYYIIIAVVIQGIISIAMYMNPAVDKYFTDLMMMDDLAKLKRAETKGERLLGYGIAFFGVGIICGVALNLVIFVLMTQRLNQVKRILLSLCYAFIFYVGLLSARTTLVGAAVSIVLLAVLTISNKSRTINNAQLLSFFGVIAVLLVVGQTLCYFYFPQFAGWAFEAFTNYSETGELRTESSDGLYGMFLLPQTTSVWMFGNAHMLFWGTDVGFTRLLFYIGLPGTIAYFYFQYAVTKASFTKYTALNYTLMAMFVLVLALNVKGLADVNSFLFIIFFYVMYRKYFIIIPEQQKLKNAQRRKYLNNSSVQSKQPVGRL